jgi:hypothetical protein
MKHTKFDSEESERARRLNDCIGTVTMMNNHCIAMMKAYFRDAEILFAYLQFKTDYSRGHESHHAFKKLLQLLRGFHKEMLNNYRCLKGLETEFHEYSHALQWLSRHLDKAQSREEKAELFTEMELRTERMLEDILKVKKEIDLYMEGFSSFYCEVTLPELN